MLDLLPAQSHDNSNKSDTNRVVTKCSSVK